MQYHILSNHINWYGSGIEDVIYQQAYFLLYTYEYNERNICSKANIWKQSHYNV